MARTAALAPHPRPFAEVAFGRHSLALLRDGAQAFPAMLEAIALARSTICLETYIYRDDFLGRRFAEALMERARNGVEVNLLCDSWGSSIGAELLHQMESAGVRVVFFHTPRWRRLFFRLWRRDHRKILTVDGSLGFTGGLNIAAEYASSAEGGGDWRDTHVRIEGPAVIDLERAFLRVWRNAGGAPVDAVRYPEPEGATEPGLRIVASEFPTERRAIRKEYLAAIKHARQRVFITSAYFLPSLRLRKALRRAARRGVDVRVILGGTTDLPSVLFAAQSLYGGWLRAGLKIFEWSGRILHAKTAVIDGQWATVGSSNLDARSLILNLELNAVVEEREFAAALERLFEEDLTSCRPVRYEDWKRRPWTERLRSRFFFWFRDWL